MAFFEVKGLSKTFGGLRAVDNLNFSLEQKEIFSIIGPNGAGKIYHFQLYQWIIQAGRRSSTLQRTKPCRQKT